MTWLRGRFSIIDVRAGWVDRARGGPGGWRVGATDYRCGWLACSVVERIRT